MRVLIDYDILDRAYRVAVITKDDGHETRAITLTVHEHVVPEGSALPYSTLKQVKGLQIFEALAKALQEAGFIPRTEYEGAGELKAQTKHLQDLQRLVFKGK